MRNFEGRVAVVTGAASGIGRATALALARRGCHVALADVNEPALKETAASVETAGRRASVHAVDVSEWDEMRRFASDVEREHGTAHVLVNNAGVSVGGSFEEQSIDDLRWILGVNLWGVIHGCKAFLPLLRRAEEAHIVNVSSMLGFIGVPGQSSYCATKFAVRGLSESLWAELYGSPVGVTSVHPGAIATNIVRDSRNMSVEDRERSSTLVDRGMAPEKAAARIVHAIEKRKLRIRIRPESYVSEWLKRLFPVAVHYPIAWAHRRGIGA